MATRRARAARAARPGPSPARPAGDLDAAGGDPAVARQVAHDRQRHRRLAAAGFADQPVGLAARDGEVDLAQHRQIAAAHPVGDVEVLHRAGPAPHSRSTPATPSATRLTPTTREAIARRVEQHGPPVAAADQAVVAGDADRPQSGEGGWMPKPMKLKRGDGEDGVAQPHRGLDQDRRQHVGQDLDEHDVQPCSRGAAGRRRHSRARARPARPSARCAR